MTLNITGDGRPTDLGIDGRLAAAPLATPFLPVVVGLNNAGVEPLYAVAAPGLMSVTQIALRVPMTVPAGTALPLVVAIGDFFSQPLTLAVR